MQLASSNTCVAYKGPSNKYLSKCLHSWVDFDSDVVTIWIRLSDMIANAPLLEPTLHHTPPIPRAHKRQVGPDLVSRESVFAAWRGSLRKSSCDRRHWYFLHDCKDVRTRHSMHTHIKRSFEEAMDGPSAFIVEYVQNVSSVMSSCVKSRKRHMWMELASWTKTG